MRKEKVFLAFGGNIGDAAQTIRSSEKLIQELPGINGVTFSRLYRTSPVSTLLQPEYINAVCCLKTTLPYKMLWKEIQEIEKALGKEQKAKNAPRRIDIDFLFYGDKKICEEGLEIPHPRWQERLFVLVPLFDLVTNIIDVDIERRIRELRMLTKDSVELY